MKVMKMKHVYVLTMVVVLVGTAAADSAPNNCIQTCGDQEIPHPFGINDTSSDSDCFLGSGRLIPLTCNESKIYTVGNLPVLNINISKAEIEVLFDASLSTAVLIIILKLGLLRIWIRTYY
jgi:hypothetical protein